MPNFRFVISSICVFMIGCQGTVVTTRNSAATASASESAAQSPLEDGPYIPLPNGEGTYMAKPNVLWPANFAPNPELRLATDDDLLRLTESEQAGVATALREDWIGREAWFVTLGGEDAIGAQARFAVGMIMGFPSETGSVVGDIVHVIPVSESELIVVLEKQSPLHLFHDLRYDSAAPTERPSTTTFADQPNFSPTCRNGGECFMTTSAPVTGAALQAVYDSIPNYNDLLDLTSDEREEFIRGRGLIEPRGGHCSETDKRKIFALVARDFPEFITLWRDQDRWYNFVPAARMQQLGDAMRANNIATDGDNALCAFKVADDYHDKHRLVSCSRSLDIAPVFRMQPRFQGHISLKRGEAWVTSTGQLDVGVRASSNVGVSCEANFVPMLERRLGRRLGFRVPLFSLYGIDVVVLEGNPIMRGTLAASAGGNAWQGTYVKHFAWQAALGVTRQPFPNMTPPIGGNNGTTGGGFANFVRGIPNDFNGGHESVTTDIARDGMLEARLSVRMELGYKLDIIAGAILEKRILGRNISLLRAGVTGYAALIAFTEGTVQLGNPEPNVETCAMHAHVEAGIDAQLGLTAEIKVLGVPIVRGDWRRTWSPFPHAVLLDHTWDTWQCVADPGGLTGGPNCAAPVCNANRGDYCRNARLTSSCGTTIVCTSQCTGSSSTSAECVERDGRQSIERTTTTCNARTCTLGAPAVQLEICGQSECCVERGASGAYCAPNYGSNACVRQVQ